MNMQKATNLITKQMSEIQVNAFSIVITCHTHKQKTNENRKIWNSPTQYSMHSESRKRNDGT